MRDRFADQPPVALLAEIARALHQVPTRRTLVRRIAAALERPARLVALEIGTAESDGGGLRWVAATTARSADGAQILEPHAPATDAARPGLLADKPCSQTANARARSLGARRIVVLPLRVGAGTKHRVFQSLAMEKPLVTSTVGAEGIALKHNETAMITDDTEEFAAYTLRLLEDVDLRERLGKAGRKLVVDNYDWRANYQKLEKVFQEAVEKRQG